MSTINDLRPRPDRGRPVANTSGVLGALPPAVRVADSTCDFYAATGLVIEHLAWIERESDIAVFAAQPALAAELADLARAYAAPPSALFVADDGASICGTLAVRFHDDGSAELKRMFVRPAARGRGHAARLLRTALEHIEQAGARRVWLESVPGLMDPAIELYRRHGFRDDTVPPLVDVEDAIVMTLHEDRGAP